jgi:AraC-like DNA-binding protein
VNHRQEIDEGRAKADRHPRHEDTLLASMDAMLRRILEMYGLDAIAIAQRAGVDLAAIPEPGQRLEADKLDAILEMVIPLIQDSAFGLQAARCWHPSHLGVLGHAWITSSTLRSGLERVARYYRLVAERISIEMEETPEGFKVRFHSNRSNPAVATVVTDIGMSLLLDMCRMNAGAALRPVRVRLSRDKPAPPGAYERFFGCPVEFLAQENAFVLSTEDTDRLLPSSNRQLAIMFDRMLNEEIARLDKSDVVARCKAALLEHMVSGEISEEDTAKRLHMSARTLQRRLAEAGTTYVQLVDDTRRDIALRYINDSRLSITDITFLLGFSYPSAFTRAYKRWTGKTPTESRV